MSPPICPGDYLLCLTKHCCLVCSYSTTHICLSQEDKTKQIMLIHLSEECNTKDLASATYYKVMKEIFDEVPNIKMKLANQRRVTTLGEDLDYLQSQNNLEDEQY